MRAWPRLALLICSTLFALPARADNYVDVILLRADDQPFPNQAFLMAVDVGVGDVVGVTNVSVQAGSLAVPMENEGGPEWDSEEAFTSFQNMTTTINGTWTITVEGSSPSTSTFTLNASSLVDGDFFQTPTNVSPAHGATDVPADFEVSWTPPPGGTSADALAVSVGNDFGGQDVDSLTGGVLITDTMWQPPMAFADGNYEVDVIYVNADPSFVTDLSTGDPIVWGDSPLGGPPYPTGRPFLLLGSDTIHGVTVPEPAAVLLQLAVLGILLHLKRRSGLAS